MDEVVDIVRRVGHQQGQNAYYGTCYTLLKKIQDLILQTSNELLDLYHSNAFEEPESVSTIAEDLRNDIQTLIARERRARSYWDESFQVRQVTSTEQTSPFREKCLCVLQCIYTWVALETLTKFTQFDGFQY
jgi:hypothetical protein